MKLSFLYLSACFLTSSNAEEINDAPVPLTPEINLQTGASLNDLIDSYNSLVGRLQHMLNTWNVEWRDLGISPIKEFTIQKTPGEPSLSSIVTDIPMLGIANPANYNNEDFLEMFNSLRPTRTMNGFRLPGFGEVVLEQPNMFPLPTQFGGLRLNLINGVPSRFVDIPELGPFNPRTLLFNDVRQNAPAEAF